MATTDLEFFFDPFCEWAWTRDYTPAVEDRFGVFVDYLPEVARRGSAFVVGELFDEITALGFDWSYPTFTRQLRACRLRPHCEQCQTAKGRPVAIIEHPAG